MLAVLAWSWESAQHRTYREVVIAHDAKIIADWDHTALLSALIHNLAVVVVSAVSKAKPKAKSAHDFHPYRPKPRTGLVINTENFHTLRQIGNALCRRR